MGNELTISKKNMVSLMAENPLGDLINISIYLVDF